METKLTDIEKIEKIAELLGYEIEGKSFDDLDEQYNEMIDEVSKTPKVGCVEMAPHKFIKENDPIAYRCGKNDWFSAEVTDGQFVEIADVIVTPDELKEILSEIAAEVEGLA